MDSSARDKIDRLGVSFAFGLEDARGEKLGRVVFLDRHDALQDDWAVVVMVVDEMNRAAAHFGAVLEDGLVDAVAVHALAAEGGNQGGVDVGDAVLEVGRDQDVFEEAAHDDETDPCLPARAKDGVAEGLGGVAGVSFDDASGDVCLDGVSQAGGVGIAGDDQRDLSV